MAQPEYPGAPDTAAYDGGDAQAIYAQLRQAHLSEPARVREFAFAAANAVSKLYCDHNDAPQPLPAGLTRDARRAAARAHPGLCGYFQSAIVAGVDFEDVVAAAEKRHVPVTLKVFRNQACYDAARALSAHGGGVQLRRCECFTHACRAIFPGDGVVEEWMETAFSSSTNV